MVIYVWAFNYTRQDANKVKQTIWHGILEYARIMRITVVLDIFGNEINIVSFFSQKKERWSVCVTYLYSTYTTYQFVSKCLLKLKNQLVAMVWWRCYFFLQIFKIPNVNDTVWTLLHALSTQNLVIYRFQKFTVTTHISIIVSCYRIHTDIFFGIELMHFSLDICFFLSTPCCQTNNCCRILRLLFFSSLYL